MNGTTPKKWYQVAFELLVVFFGGIAYIVLLYTVFLSVLSSTTIGSVLAQINATFLTYVIIAFFLVVFFAPPYKFLWPRGKKYFLVWILGAFVTLILSISFTLTREPPRGINSALKSYMSNYRVFAEVYFETHNQSYKGFCDDATLDTTKEAILSHIDMLPACFDSDLSFAAEIRLKDESDGYYCVDSSGQATSTKETSITEQDQVCGD